MIPTRKKKGESRAKRKWKDESSWSAIASAPKKHSPCQWHSPCTPLKRFTLLQPLLILPRQYCPAYRQSRSHRN